MSIGPLLSLAISNSLEFVVSQNKIHEVNRTNLTFKSNFLFASIIDAH